MRLPLVTIRKKTQAMNEKDFERILNKSESSTIDFKTKMYDFDDDKDFSKTSKFIKDIISFSNTIRSESSFIIIGVQEEDNGSKSLNGLDKYIDDSLLQDKIKDKVNPRPHFKFYTFEYNAQTYGIIEFPIVKYSTPIIPTVKIRGLEVGKVYYRHGTTNAEATGLEVIRINDWFRNMEDFKTENNLNEEIADILKQLTSKETKLSVILSDLLKISKKYNINDLTDFCISEIKGIPKSKIDANPEMFKYRNQKVLISLNKIKINPYSLVKLTANMIRKEMEENEHFFDFRLLFSNPISEIEDYIDNFSKNPESYGTLKMSSKQIFPDENSKDYPITVYVFAETVIDLYRCLRQKMIDKLIEL